MRSGCYCGKSGTSALNRMPCEFQSAVGNLAFILHFIIHISLAHGSGIYAESAMALLAETR